MRSIYLLIAANLALGACVRPDDSSALVLTSADPDEGIAGSYAAPGTDLRLSFSVHGGRERAVGIVRVGERLLVQVTQLGDGRLAVEIDGIDAGAAIMGDEDAAERLRQLFAAEPALAQALEGFAAEWSSATAELGMPHWAIYFGTLGSALQALQADETAYLCRHDYCSDNPTYGSCESDSCFFCGGCFYKCGGAGSFCVR